MDQKIIRKDVFTGGVVVTAGSTYLDIDAYACCVAMKELLELKGENVIAYSRATCNYSVCGSLVEEGQIERDLPADFRSEAARYIVVDVSDPDYIKDDVPPEKVVEIYDHHVGFEAYWESRIGSNAHIEFIGAAATLIYREWEKSGRLNQMTRATARLLVAAILDNTLNLMSANTTAEDREAFDRLCQKANIGTEWCASYFAEVQAGIEEDLKNALFHDIKIIQNNAVLPSRVAQICIWDAEQILEKLADIRSWFSDVDGGWMINVIDLQHRCSYFVCDSYRHQREIERVFDVHFESGVAKSSVPYLRKELIKKSLQQK